MAGDDLSANPPWLARVDHADGWVGAGFLVDERTVVTCGHTVPAPEPGASTEVEVRFVHASSPAPVRAHVAAADHHFDEEGAADLAVVRLDEPPPPGAVPATLVGQRQLAGHHVVLHGFPATPGDWGDQGEWGSRIEAVVSTLGGPRHGWWELLDRTPGPPGPWVAEGFSGGPVWLPGANGVVAMTVAGSESRRQAYAIPLEVLVDAEPTLRLRIQPPPDDADVEADLRAELADLEARLRPEDPRLTGCRYGLAVTLLDAEGDVDEAVDLLTGCIDDIEMHGHPPARAFGMWLTLADVRLDQRHDGAALDAVHRAGAIGEAAFGAEDARMASVQAREALALLQRCDVAAADTAARRAQALAAGSVGLARLVAEALWARAQVALVTDPGEAERLTKRLLDLTRRVLPPDHPGLLRPSLLRGQALATLGERGAARELFDGALDLARDRYGHTHGAVADCRLALARLDLLETPSASLDDCLRALEAGESAFSGRPSRLVPYLLTAASARQAAGDVEEAFLLADRAVQLSVDDFGPDHPAVIDAYMARAQTWPPSGGPGPAVDDAERAHAIAESTSSDVVPVIVPSLTLLASARLLQQRPADAVDAAARAVDVVEGSPFARLPVATAARRMRGFARFHVGDFGDAAADLTAALRANESFFGTAHPLVGTTYLELAECERARGNAAAADAARKKGSAILDRALPPDHPFRRQLEQGARAAAVTGAASRVARWLSRPAGSGP